MKRSELKKIIQPIVKECVQDILLKEGLLSNIVSEVAKGMGGQVIQESRPAPSTTAKALGIAPARDDQARLDEIKARKRKLLDAIGKDAYNGVDIFEDTKPIVETKKSNMGPANPLTGDGRTPDDPGVDITGILSIGGKNWKALMG